MNPKSLPGVITLILSIFLSVTTKAQSFGALSSAVWLTDCNQSDYYNTSGSGATVIGPVANVFTGANLGAYTQNSGGLILRGGEVRTFKNPGVANVCGVRMYYRVYLQSGVPGAFNAIDLPLFNDCNVPAGSFPSGGSCGDGDQKWKRVIPDGATSPYAPVNLTAYAPGNYVLEVYYEVTGSSSSTTLCDETIVLNNAANNYKASFSIQSPVLASTNPITCNGAEGSITINGLVAGVSYGISYSDDGVLVGPLNLVANGSGQVILSGLDAGVYSEFVIETNGCTTELNTGLILSDPVFTPKFNKIAPFCAGSTPPSLPTTSTNGITGTWNPSVIDNQASGSYTFTPTPGQCGLSATINVTVIPNITPTFTFGTSMVICGSGTVPLLPNTSGNGINGTWNPAVVDDQNSGTYTFTPSPGQCATTATFSVTVNPNITPTFSFGTSLAICAGEPVPSLPATSINGITGSWSPATVDNQNSGAYTFTPAAEQCATTTTFTVTVNPIVTPVFSFGPALTICAGGPVPTLSTTSDNGIAGTWSASSVDNQTSGVYTFTPAAGQCAVTTTFTVTVNPNITPTFTFGTSMVICGGGSVPALPNTSGNGITGSWSPATVDDQASATYTFTPAPGQCATIATFSVTVNPNITPTFSFGTSLAICAGTGVPALPTTSGNGITGTWNPAAASDQNSGTYTFTPAAGQCATTTTLTVTVNPNTIPAFSFGPSLVICAGGTVPTLPTTSANGINGTWSPAVVSNQTSGVYIFTPATMPGQCISSVRFVVTVNQIVTPTFGFGTSQIICAGTTVPVLPTTSANGVTGTWSPAVVSNQTSGVYIFTTAPGQCAVPSTTFTVTVPPVATVNATTDISVTDGTTIPMFSPSGTPAGVSFSWTNSNTAIGLAASGTGNVPSFTAINKGTIPLSATITVTPIINGCAGTSMSYVITVTPLEKDVFVPNVFSPNGDGKNDILFAYGNYIDQLDMRIFNQWGEQVYVINSKTKGWDGTFKGKPQPVGVYVYALKAVLSDGRTVQMKGSITLVR
jgi:large repetitive protein